MLDTILHAHPTLRHNMTESDGLIFHVPQESEGGSHTHHRGGESDVHLLVHMNIPGSSDVADWAMVAGFIETKR